jgi:hypothetical protein
MAAPHTVGSVVGMDTPSFGLARGGQGGVTIVQGAFVCRQQRADLVLVTQGIASSSARLHIICIPWNVCYANRMHKSKHVPWNLVS